MTDQPITEKPEASLPASLSGANHPLAAVGKPPESSPANTSGAVELIAGPNNSVEQKPLAKLAPGDHTIQLESGRQFLVHIPKTPIAPVADPLNSGAASADSSASKTLPAMFVFSGSGEPQWNIKDFAPESGMSTVADEDPKHPFVVVYPLPEEHKLGVYSAQEAYGYNSTGVLIDQQDRKAAGYDDVDYVKSIAGLMPQIADVDSTHKDWGAMAFSQGGLFLNKLIATVPDLFPSVSLVGTSMQKNYKYDVQHGNAQDVQIVELLGDKITLPMRGLFSQSLKYDEQLAERFLLHDLVIGKFHGKSVIERTEPLAAIHNENQSPILENKLYTGLLGKGASSIEGEKDGTKSPYTVTRSDLTTPVASSKKDFEIDYVPVDPNDNRRVIVYGLVQAQHSFPAPLYGPRTNATTKYTEFDASRRFAKMFDDYNDKVHLSQTIASVPTDVAAPR